MALLKREQRKRTRRFDLDAAAREADPGRLAAAFSSDRLFDTLVGALFGAAEVFIITFRAKFVADEVSTIGVALTIAAMNVLMFLYIAEHHRRDLLDHRPRLLVFQAITLGAFVLAKLFSFFGWPPHLFPLGVFGIGLSIAFGQRFGMFWTLLFAIVASYKRGLPAFDFPVGANLLVGALFGILVLGPRVSRRNKVIRAGIATGVAYAAMTLATEFLLEGRGLFLDALQHRTGEVALRLGFGVLNGLFTGYFIVEFGLRFIEVAFDVVTDLRLQELADLNQPILKKFSIEAPGTFHHSQMVGTLAEAAAESIGANALLCRVGAHFHDIGKMAKPEYYIENITSGSPTKHDGLTPNMSTLIIVSHVKDGLEMAEELGLPRCVVDCIPEHHGTIAVEYFYHQACKQQKRDGGPEVSKDDFRYPGPRPQSRETAILMIADSVEAISRVLTDPNPARIEQMVHDVVMRRLQEGQLDECAITLAELKRVEEGMSRILNAIFHGRIKYPKAATVDRPSEADSEDARAGDTQPMTPGVSTAPSATAGGQPMNASDTASRI
ncbi:MAG TPA: HDIG domain-containing protein, partial [Planctomycetota bacterium]|nr:HDIG domain-containing protein [Planctomycetota bacterium]